MTVHTLRGVQPPKPKPNDSIVELLRSLLPLAEAGELQDIAIAWATADSEFTAFFTPDRVWLGGVTYGMAHEMMTGDRE